MYRVSRFYPVVIQKIIILRLIAVMFSFPRKRVGTFICAIYFSLSTDVVVVVVMLFFFCIVTAVAVDDVVVIDDAMRK